MEKGGAQRPMIWVLTSRGLPYESEQSGAHGLMSRELTSRGWVAEAKRGSVQQETTRLGFQGEATRREA